MTFKDIFPPFLIFGVNLIGFLAMRATIVSELMPSEYGKERSAVVIN